jgi:hypothetical protein
MDPDTAPTPKSPPAKTARDARLEREAAALRANLRKRKDQARAREAEAEENSVTPHGRH